MDATRSGVTVERVGDDPDFATFRTRFDQEKTPASMAIIETLAEVMDADPIELDPLYATVDPDALDALVRARTGPSGDVHASFAHEGHEITVSSYGVVEISRGGDPTAESGGSDAGR